MNFLLSLPRLLAPLLLRSLIQRVQLNLTYLGKELLLAPFTTLIDRYWQSDRRLTIDMQNFLLSSIFRDAALCCSKETKVAF